MTAPGRRRIKLAIALGTSAAAVLTCALALVVIGRCSRPPAAPPAPRLPSPPPVSTTTLVVRVTDRGAPVGARVLLLAGPDAPLHMGTIDMYGKRQSAAACPIAPDVIGSWDGLIFARGVGEVPVGVDGCVPSPAIPYGRYQVLAWRGVEYELWRGAVDLSARRGRVELDVPLERAWIPYGTLAADLHVHAHASIDSTMPNPQRVIAQAAAGIEVIALSDHNASGDLDAEIAALGLEDAVASIASNELTSELFHLGVYPVQVVRGAPRGGGPPESEIVTAGAAKLFALGRTLSPAGVLQVNHPRLRASALFDNTGWDGVAWPPPFPLVFDAMEVLSGHTAFNTSGDRRIDETVRDYYTLLDHGHPIAPLGNSDTHDLNWILDGTARTYVFVDRPSTAPFDEAAFLDALRGRRVVATTGPWLDLEVAAQVGGPTVGPGQLLRARGRAWLDLTVQQAAFVHTSRVRITVGGPRGRHRVVVIDVPPKERSFRWVGAVEVGAVDTWIGVIAEGDDALPLEVTGTHHHDYGRSGVTPYAIVGPVLVDADGDGKWTRGDASPGRRRRR